MESLLVVPIATFVFLALGLWSLYWVVRLAVRHALLDVERGRSRPVERRYDSTT